MELRFQYYCSADISKKCYCLKLYHKNVRFYSIFAAFGDLLPFGNFRTTLLNSALRNTKYQNKTKNFKIIFNNVIYGKGDIRNSCRHFCRDIKFIKNIILLLLVLVRNISLILFSAFLCC
jgi:hypothetical protein